MRLQLDIEITSDELESLEAFELVAERFPADSPIHVAARILAERDRELSPVNNVEFVGSSRSWKQRARVAKRKLVEKAIRAHGGNVSAAARTLGTTRQTLYSLLGRSRRKPKG